MQALCCVRDCSGNPFARSEQKIGTESPLKRTKHFSGTNGVRYFRHS